MSIPYMNSVHIRVFSEEFPKYADRFQEMRRAYVMWMSTDNCMLELVPKADVTGQPQMYNQFCTDWSFK